MKQADSEAELAEVTPLELTLPPDRTPSGKRSPVECHRDRRGSSLSNCATPAAVSATQSTSKGARCQKIGATVLRSRSFLTPAMG